MLTLNKKPIQKMIIVAVLLSAVFLGVTGTACADSITVNESESIQDAIDDANNGDTIEVGPGTYEEQLEIAGVDKNNIELIGSTDENGLPTSIINLSDLTDDHGIMIKDTNGVTVQNFEVHSSPDRGVYAYNTSGVIIDNIVSHNNDNDGIRIKKDKNATVQNCESYDNNGDGLTFYAYGNILNNNIRENKERGIYHVGSSAGGTGNVTIIGNHLTGNKMDHKWINHHAAGIEVYGGPSDNPHTLSAIVEDNVVKGNHGNGIQIYKVNYQEGKNGPYGDYQSTLKGNEVSGSIATDDTYGDGILVYLSHNLDIGCNDICNSTAAIRLTTDYPYGNQYGPTTNNTMTCNYLYDNEYGVLVEGGDDYQVLDTVVHRNNIYGNNNGLSNQNNGDEVVNATNNWWGDSSGPTGEGSGEGKSVSTNVEYEPVETDEVECACEEPSQNVPDDYDHWAGVPTANPVLLVGVLGIAVLLFLRREQKK
ncbi:MAG: right-handed parallel beta-helix repeat-containing protein [Methanohalobium sp.]|uniref:right-handed parallel beta-helix repeat-containing protein n=1 Tax=Methanohalobium sp. TaxID=2837493 RepID=UPI00397C2597